MDTKALTQQMTDTLLSLATEEGINASSRTEIYGCLFGRDGAITVLQIMKAHQLTPNPELLDITKRTLLSLVRLQGMEVNIESGEEPGKFIHEYRTEGYDHLVNSARPWYLYPDQTIRNYDSIDSTPLGLIALYRYWQATRDEEFLEMVLPAVKRGLTWIQEYGDRDGDGFLEFSVHPDRKHGGLTIHSWTDSHESFLGLEGLLPAYPIAPVEVQGYAWLATKLWSDYFETIDQVLSDKLREYAGRLKQAFNEQFFFEQDGWVYAAQGLDGEKRQIRVVTGNPLLCLTAAYTAGGAAECIIADEYLSPLIQRAFRSDMFDTESGVRTMSSTSPTFNPNPDSYHNGSFWPVLNGLAYQGLKNFGYDTYANMLKEASLKPIVHFGSAIELYSRTESGYEEYKSPSGQTGCREQAWSAGAILAMVVE